MNLKIAFKTLSVTLLSVIGTISCTVYLPPTTDEPIPAADPITASDEDVKATEKESTDHKATTKNKKAPSREEQVHYVVKEGDTVFKVMRVTGVHWTNIIRLNSLKAPKYTIHPGRSLRIK